jgi:hypothetical protein
MDGFCLSEYQVVTAATSCLKPMQNFLYSAPVQEFSVSADIENIEGAISNAAWVSQTVASPCKRRAERTEYWRCYRD